MKYVRSNLSLVILSTVVALLLPSAVASTSSSWQVPNDGFMIDLSTPSGIPQKSGTSAQIQGSITWIGGRPLTTGGLGWGNSSHNSDVLTTLLQQDGVAVHAYFPDPTTDVTSSVKFQASRDSITVNYQTPTLSASNLNVFTLVISHPDPMLTQLSQIQAKLDVRIPALQTLLASLQAQHVPSGYLQGLQNLLATLEAVSQRITQQLLAGNEIMAQQRFALQVDNAVAANSFDTTLIEPFRFTVAYDLGSAIQGESTTAHGTIMRDPSDPSNGQGAGNWIARFFWDSNLVKTLSSQAIAPGASVSFDYPIGPLSPNNDNSFSETLTSSKYKNDPGNDWSDDWWNDPNFWSDQGGGALAYALPVAKDTTKPTWLAGSTPDTSHPYVQTPQPVSATIQDAFGLVDPTSLQAELTSTPNGGTTSSANIISSLSVLSPDQGQTYQITGNLGSLAEGYYTFALSGKDLAGNVATPNPLQANFRVDVTPPQIALSQPNACIGQGSVNVTASVADWSPVTNIVTLNGTTILQNSLSPSGPTTELNTTFPVTAQLATGANTISLASVDSAGNQASPVNVQVFYDNSTPQLTLGVQDNIYTNQPTFSIPISVTDIGMVTTQVSQNGSVIATSTQKSFTVQATLVQLNNTFSIQTTNCAGVTTTASLNHIFLDTIPPAITLGQSDNQLTRFPAFTLPITVVDEAPVTTTVLWNGSQIAQSAQVSFSVSVTLTEGLNTFTVESTDAAGNSSTAALSNIVLDTIPPVLSNLSPPANSILSTLSFTVSGISNEALMSASVNGQPLALSSGNTAFSGTYSVPAAGSYTLAIQASDLAGNISSTSIPIQVVLSALNGNLISVAPDPDGSHLDIIGAAGAAQSGITVNATAGLFNSGSATASSSGSFLIQMAQFTTATVSATDPLTSQTTSVTVTYGSTSGTKLAGTVMDTSGNPLPGVTVSFQGLSLSTVTDGSGTFAFQQPTTGDQVLVFDGTTVPTSVTNGQEQFSVVDVSINVGLGQSNVLQTPIYLAPLNLTTAQSIPASGSVTVTDANAPGAQLNFDASTITFPTKSAHAISMSKLSSTYSTIPPMPYAYPQHVFALEPSGTTFSAPAQLTLPNDNQFPPGVDLLILSMNSQKGIWEIDGAATVSSDGSSIVTKAGMGITHFSAVYATPPGPQITQAGGQDHPGADATDGGVVTEIDLPSYSSGGTTITPSLKYNSTWAKPSALVTNVFNLPPNSVSISEGSQLFGLSLVTASIQGQAFVEPISVQTQFSTADIQTPVATYSPGVGTILPPNALVSFEATLTDPNTGAYLASGVYPFQAQFNLVFNELIVGTETAVIHPLFGSPVIEQAPFSQTVTLQQAFPSNVTGPIYVQNKAASAAGKGWKIEGAQQILNPSSNRLLLEEADGSISGFVLNNTITTLANGSTLGFDLTEGADLASWPVATVTIMDSTNTRHLGSVDLSAGTPALTNLGLLNQLYGQYYTLNSPATTGQVPNGTVCNFDTYNAYLPLNAVQLLKTSDGTILGTSNYVYENSNSIVFSFLNGVTTPSAEYANTQKFYVLGGNLQTTANFQANYADLQTFAYGVDPLVPTGTVNIESAPDAAYDGLNVCQAPISPISGSYAPGSSNYQATDPFGEPLLVPGALFDNPMGITESSSGQIVVADTGNNLVRGYNPTTHVAFTIAGSGSNLDNGDGGPATSASMFHPQGVVYDSVGNLYISTANGYIRRVDATGTITTVAGLPVSSGGVLTDSGPAATFAFNNPFGLAFDNTNGYLYVADTGNNRVVQINMNTLVASTVAGNGTPGYNGDNQAALAASLSAPTLVGLDNQNNLLIADSGNNRIRRVTFQNAVGGTLAYSSTTNDPSCTIVNADGSITTSCLVRNNDGTWTRSYRNGTVVAFNSSGQETASTDLAERTTTFSYDGSGRVTAMTDPTGRAVQYTYSGALLSAITDPDGRTTQFLYNGVGNLIQVLFPDGSNRQFSYDGTGLLTAEMDARGNTTQYQYNQYDRLANVVRADGTIVAFSDEGSQTVAGAGPLTFKGAGPGPMQVHNTVVDANSDTTSVVQDSNGYIETITDALGDVTTFQRDNFGKVTQITRADGSTLSFAYDQNTQDLLSQTDSGTGIVTSQTYDRFGNILTKTDGNGLTSKLTYYSNELVHAKVDPMGHTTTYVYSGPLQLLASSTNYLGDPTQYVYDSNGNRTDTIDAKGDRTHAVLDNAGNALTVTDANGNVTQNTYDLFNRIISVTTPKGEKTSYTYLATGQLASVADALGNSTVFQYDVLNRLTKKTDSLGNTTTEVYDANGNIIQEVDPNGNVKSYKYDALNRLTEKLLPDNVVTLSYDVRSNLKSIANQQSIVNMTYDDLGRMLTTQTQGIGANADLPSATLSYTYDGDNNRLTLADTAGDSFSYSYDNADRLTFMGNAQNEAYSFAYNDTTGSVTLTRPGSQTVRAIDAAGFISSLVHSSGETTINSFAYQVDRVGNATSIVSSVGSRSIAYDGDNQVAAASNSEAPASTNLQSESFGYDSISNRTSDQAGAYNYGAGSQRLVSDYRYYYFYDNNGNLISRQSQTIGGEVTNYVYSSENQLMGFTIYQPQNDNPSTLYLGSLTGQSPVESVSYVYDGLGRRIQKNVVDYASPSNPTKTFVRSYLYDGFAVLLETDGSNNVLARYTTTPNGGSPMAVNVSSAGVAAQVAQNAGTYEYLKDGAGTVTDITDTHGTKLQHYVYSAFGERLAIQDASENDISSNPVLNTGYALGGQVLDPESALYFLNARYYNPCIGRFLQQDPDPGKLNLPSTVTNRYVYALNNPFGYSDPSGRTVLGSILGALGIAAASIIIGPWALLALGIAGSVSAVITGISTGNWSFENLANAFLVGGGTAALVGLAGFGAGALATTLGGGIGWSIGAGALASAATSIGIAAWKAGGLGDLSLGEFIISGVAGAIGGTLSGYSGAIAAGAKGFEDIPAWIPGPMGGTEPEAAAGATSACAESTSGPQTTLTFCNPLPVGP